MSSKIQLTLINPLLENTKEDIVQLVKSAELHLKEELYINSGWRKLKYEKIESFLADDYFSLASKVAAYINEYPS